MADESKTITIQFRGESASLDNEVNHIEKMIKVLQAETRNLEKKMKFGDDYATQMKYYDEAISNVGQSIALAKKSQEYWNGEIEKYKEIMVKKRPLTDAEMNYLRTAERKYAEAGKQVANLTEQFKRLGKEQDNYNRLSIAEKIKKDGDSVKKLGQSVEKVADSFKYMSLAAGAALTGSANAAITFETAMANVNKVLKDSEKDYLGTLQQQILDMSRVLPLTAQEIAQVTANALQLGISAKDVGKFTETILKLGTATNISSEEAAIAIAQLFNVTGEQYDNIDRFGAALTSLGNQFPTFESNIMEMARKIAAAGSSVGMTTTDILGLSTALASMGLSADAGGSSVSTILRKIDTDVANSTKDLYQWADRANMSAEQFKRAWESDVTGTFQRLVNSIADSVRKGENLNTILGNLGINAIRQKDAFSRLVQANDTLNDALYESRDAWNALARGEQGALNDEFAEKVKTLASQFQLLKNELYYVGVQIGQEMMPALRKAVDLARQLVDWFINLSPAAKKWVTVFLGAVASIYPILKGVGKAISSIGSLLLGVAGIVKNGVTIGGAGERLFGGLLKIVSAISKFAGVMATPLAVIGALAGAFAFLYKTCEQFREGINKLTTAFEARMIAKTWQLYALLKEFGGWLAILYEQKIKPLFENLIQLYHQFIEPALSYMMTALTKLLYQVIVNVYEWVIKIIDYLIKFAKPVIEVIIDAIKALAIFLVPIVDIIFTLIGAIAELVSWLWGKLDVAIKESIEIIGNIIQAFLEVGKIIIEVVIVAIQWLVDKFVELFAFLENVGVIEAFKIAFEGIVTVIQKAVEWFTKLLDKFAQWKRENPSLGDIKSNWENQTGQRAGSTGVMPNIFNVNQRNTFNGTTSQQTVAAANNMIDLINNGLGKKLTF